MASRRAQRRRQCGSKTRHGDASSAWGHATWHMRKNNDGRMRAYFCRFCKGWHVGHA